MPPSAKLRAERKAQDLCTRHGNSKPCATCVAKHKKYRANHADDPAWLEKNRKRSADHRIKCVIAKVCIQCGDPSPQFQLCLICRLDRSERRQKQDARRRRTKQVAHDYYVRTRDLHRLSTAVEILTSHQNAISPNMT